MPSFTPGSIPLSRDAESFTVCWFDPTKPFPSCYQQILNVVPVQIEEKIGPYPAICNLRYIFDPNLFGPDFPSRVDQILDLNALGGWVVKQDDRIVVLKDDNDGSYTVLFDGFAQVPQGNLAGKTETTTFRAFGVAVREWDSPLPCATYRQGPDPTVIFDVPTALPARFNPTAEDGDGQDGNATPAGSDSHTGAQSYPVFYDLQVDPDLQQYFYVHSAARYIMGVGNLTGDYVRQPGDFAVFDDLLDERLPGDGGFDPDDPLTYTSGPIVVDDIDVAGNPWPVAMEKVLAPHGFGFWFETETLTVGVASTPFTTFKLFRYDGGGSLGLKDIYLQVPGEDLDPASTNVGEISLARDSSDIQNAVVLDADAVLYEASFVLAPGFVVSAGDAATPQNFAEGNPAFTGDNRTKYREYIFSEAGDGWWDFTASAMNYTCTSLDKIFGAPVPGVGALPPLPKYANRRRKPGSTLVTLVGSGSNSKKAHAELWFSGNSPELPPSVWDGSATDWQRITGNWEVLHDRIGIRITAADLNNVSFENVADAATPTATPKTSTGVIKLVKSIASPDIANSRLYFRLTCTIESDQNLNATANRRDASTTSFTITRREQVRNRFSKRVVCRSGAPAAMFGAAFPAADEVVVDETPEAIDYAAAVRDGHDAATFSGSVTIPRFTLAYRLGDRIRSINGRDMSLRQNVGAELQNAPRYPIVVGRTWEFEKQITTLHLTDLRAEPAQQRQRGRRG
jgi:hypothetical protein